MTNSSFRVVVARVNNTRVLLQLLELYYALLFPQDWGEWFLRMYILFLFFYEITGLVAGCCVVVAAAAIIVRKKGRFAFWNGRHVFIVVLITTTTITATTPFAFFRQ